MTPASFDQVAARWPLLLQREVTLGGTRVTVEQALAACDALAASGACAIRSVLLAARNPLAACDYHAVYRPGLEKSRRALAQTHKPGGAGRHAAKHAFAQAVREEVSRAARAALEDALKAFARDERYAVAIARDATAIKRQLPALRAA